MRKSNYKIFLPVLLLFTVVGCKKYLNINSDPDTTQSPSNSSVFPAMLAGIPRGVQYDARYLGKYIQNWNASATNDDYDRMGPNPVFNSDNTGDIWRQTYFGLGGNLEYIIKNGLNKNQFDYVGASLVLKALMFQMAADYHGQIIYTEAFKEGIYYFNFDDQDVVYKGIDSLCRDAVKYLDMAIAAGNSTLATADFSFGGNLQKWKKLAYSLLAKNFHRYANKSSYSADSVIKYCDMAMATVDDDFVVPFDASKNDDSNFWGPYRNNLASFRQSNFIVKLLDGTTLAGSTTVANRDPRISHMLSSSPDTTNGSGTYRGVEPGLGDPFIALLPPSSYLVNGLPPTLPTALVTYNNARKKTVVPWGDSLYANPSATVFTAGSGKYLFKDKVVMPVITYAEIQFIAAEASYKQGNKSAAHAAYLNGINAHFDFINKNYSNYRGNSPLYNGSPISTAARNNYLASANVKQSSANLNLSDIMLQKYIALWAWGWVETWVDLRRYHYSKDTDPATGLQVYKNFSLPASLHALNIGLPVQRVKPRYNSEYVWNLEVLKTFGADKSNYHTVECWFSKP